MIGRTNCARLLAALVSESASDRFEAADSVRDLFREYDVGEVRVLGSVLSWLVLTETDETAQEAQLNSLGELYVNTELPLSIAEQVLSLDREKLPVYLHTQYNDLAEAIEEMRALGRP